jgi:alkylated DNA repair dioxygenase AlkB
LLGIYYETDIVSVSLGTERTFILYHKKFDTIAFKQVLYGGDMVWMKGKCQKWFEHEVPREPKIKTPR